MTVGASGGRIRLDLIPDPFLMAPWLRNRKAILTRDSRFSTECALVSNLSEEKAYRPGNVAL